MAQRLGVCCRSLLCLIYWLNILARSTAATSCWNQRNIDAVWREFVPYTDDENDVDWRLNGILPLVVEDMLAECCYAELAGINYTAKSENAVDLEKAFNSGGYGIALPVAFKVTALGGYFRALNGNTTHFIPVIESPGSVLVMTVNKSKQIGSDLVNIIFDGWPLLLIIIVSAGVAGIVMWLLDRWRNPIEFPRPFIRGFWEGFWWAFVTMTTVGYGDRSPRSIPARLFGIIWIIVGVAILSVFTAIVTTEMTENTFAVEYNLQGMKVGVVNGTEEHRVALDSGAEIAVFTSHREMLRNPVSYLDGYLVDQYFTAARANEIAKHGLGVAKLVHNPVYYGLMVTNMEDETIGCFHDYVIRNRQRVFVGLNEMIGSIRPITFDVLIQPEPLFHSDTVTLILYTMAGWACIVIVGIIWEMCCWRPRHRREKAKNAKEYVGRNASEDETRCDEGLPTISQNLTKKQQWRIRGQINSGYEDCTIEDSELYRAPSNTNEDERQLSLMARSQLTGISGLEGLIMRQNSELLCLEEEIIIFRQNWEKKVIVLQEKHKREQLQYLNTIKHGELPASF